METTEERMNITSKIHDELISADGVSRVAFNIGIYSSQYRELSQFSPAVAVTSSSADIEATHELARCWMFQPWHWLSRCETVTDRVLDDTVVDTMSAVAASIHLRNSLHFL